MRRNPGVMLILAACAVALVLPFNAARAQKQGLQVDLGLGFTGGIDAEEALGLGDIDESAGATLRFGATYKMPISGENFYLNPTFQIGFFNEEIDFGGAVYNIGGTNYNLNKMEWSTTQINFGVNPTYYFMPATAKLRPYGGLGVKLNINSFGDVDVTAQQGSGTIEVDGKTSLALGPMVGVDYMLDNGMAIPFVLQYDLLFAEDMGGVFLVSTGAIFYF